MQKPEARSSDITTPTFELLAEQKAKAEKAAKSKAMRPRKQAIREGEREEMQDHPLTLRYQPEYLARGGEHLVYEIPGHPKSVVKVNKGSIFQALEMAEDITIAPEDREERLQAQLEAELAKRRETEMALRKHFGVDHVVPQRYFIQDVPLPEDIDEELKPFYGKRKNAAGTVKATHCKAIVAMQPRVPELQGPHLSPSVGLVEFRRLPKMFESKELTEEYARMTDPFMSAEGTKNTDLQAYEVSHFVRMRDVSHLLGEMEQDPELQKAMRSFIEGAVSYAEATGEIFDFNKDNVIFFKKGDGWDHQVIDGSYAFQDRVIDTAKRALFKMRIGRRLDDPESNAFYQTVNFTRSVNSLGKLAGAKKAFDFLPPSQGSVFEAMCNTYPALKHLKAK